MQLPNAAGLGLLRQPAGSALGHINTDPKGHAVGHRKVGNAAPTTPPPPPALPPIARPSGPELPAFGGDRGLFEISQQRQELQHRSMDYSLSIETADGRKASLSFSYESLAYSRSSTQAIFSRAPGGEDAMSSARLRTLGELLRGAEESGSSLPVDALAFAHEEINIEASSFELEIEGDIGLLQDYFNAENTADRIFGFVSDLANMGTSFGADFGSMFEQIRSGVEQGFEQAKMMIGELPQVSQDTGTLLDAMLDAFGMSGEPQEAADFLHLLDKDDDEAAGLLA